MGNCVPYQEKKVLKSTLFIHRVLLAAYANGTWGIAYPTREIFFFKKYSMYGLLFSKFTRALTFQNLFFFFYQSLSGSPSDSQKRCVRSKRGGRGGGSAGGGLHGEDRCGIGAAWAGVYGCVCVCLCVCLCVYVHVYVYI